MTLSSAPKIHSSDQKINKLFSREKLIQAYGGKKNVDQYHLGYRDPFLQQLRQKFSDDTIKKMKSLIGFTAAQEQKAKQVANQFNPADEVAGIISVIEDDRKGFLLADRGTIYKKHLSIDVGRHSMFDICRAFSQDCGSQRPSADAFMMLACIIAQGGNPDYLKSTEECLFWKGYVIIRDKQTRKVSAKFSILGRSAPQEITQATSKPEKVKKRPETLNHSINTATLNADHHKQYLLGITLLKSKLTATIGSSIQATIASLPADKKAKYKKLKLEKTEATGSGGSFNITVKYSLNGKKFAIHAKLSNGKLTIQKENIWAARGLVKQYSPRGAEMLKNLQWYFKKASSIAQNTIRYWRGMSQNSGLSYKLDKNNPDIFSESNIAGITKVITGYFFEKEVDAKKIKTAKITINEAEKKMLHELKIMTRWRNIIAAIKKTYKGFSIKFTPGYKSAEIYQHGKKLTVVKFMKSQTLEKKDPELMKEITAVLKKTPPPRNQVQKRTRQRVSQLKKTVQRRVARTNSTTSVKPTTAARQVTQNPKIPKATKQYKLWLKKAFIAAQKVPAMKNSLSQLSIKEKNTANSIKLSAEFNKDGKRKILIINYDYKKQKYSISLNGNKVEGKSADISKKKDAKRILFQALQFIFTGKFSSSYKVSEKISKEIIDGKKKAVKKRVYKKIAPAKKHVLTTLIRKKEKPIRVIERTQKPKKAAKYETIDPSTKKTYKQQIKESIPSIDAPRVMLEHVLSEFKKVWQKAIVEPSWMFNSRTLAKKILETKIYKKNNEYILKIKVKGRDKTADLFLRYHPGKKQFIVTTSDRTKFNSITKSSEKGNISDLTNSANIKKIIKVLSWGVAWNFRRSWMFYEGYVNHQVIEGVLKGKDLKNTQLRYNKEMKKALEAFSKEISSALEKVKKTIQLFKKDTLNIELAIDGRSARLIVNNTVMGKIVMVNKNSEQIYAQIKSALESFRKKAQKKCLEVISYLNSSLPKGKKITHEIPKKNKGIIIVAYNGKKHELAIQKSNKGKGMYQIRDPKELTMELRNFMSKSQKKKSK